MNKLRIGGSLSGFRNGSRINEKDSKLFSRTIPEMNKPRIDRSLNWFRNGSRINEKDSKLFSYTIPQMNKLRKNRWEFEQVSH